VLITKFNRMVRNRFVWAVVAIIVSLSMVWYIGPGGRSGRGTKDEEAGVEGRLFGQKVLTPDYYQARFFEIGLDERNLPDTVKANEALRLRTWKRIVALQTAERLGISTSDEEVGQMLQQQRGFQERGVFSRAKYEGTVRGQFRGLAVYREPLAVFETYARESITLRKLMDLLRTAVWISPAELSQRLSNLTDSMVVEHVAVERDAAADKVAVSRAEAQEFFSRHVTEFERPERLNVKYVAFPVARYLAAASNKVSDAGVAAYYDEHLEEFPSVSTNDTNTLTVARPLDEVRDDIRARLAEQTAVFDAKDAAVEFAMVLAPDREGRAPDFVETAVRTNLNVATSAFFAVWEAVPGLDVGFDFNRAAFSLDPADAEKSVSDAIVGESNVYVFAVNERRPARLPEFDEVADEVMPVAAGDAQQRAYLDRVNRVRDALVAGLAGGRSFTEAATGLGLNVVTSPAFTVMESYSTNAADYLSALRPILSSLRKGEVSEPVSSESDALLACLAVREPGDALSVQSLRPELLSTLQGYRAALAFDEWCESLLKDARLEDLHPIREEAPDASRKTEEPAPSEDDGSAKHLDELL